MSTTQPDLGATGVVGASTNGAAADELVVLPPLPRRRRSSSRGLIALGVVGIALGLVIWQGLGSAALYFYTADKAVARQASLGQRRFRLEGVVATDAKDLPDGTGIEFRVEEGGAAVLVHHKGSPGELFQIGGPVVLEGAFAPAGQQPAGADALPLFVSDLMMTKHTRDYANKYPDRVSSDPAVGAQSGANVVVPATTG